MSDETANKLAEMKMMTDEIPTGSASQGERKDQ
jgi:hypothetical protein